jgi:uncharacterized repeat protein (TIGR03943 family)
LGSFGLLGIIGCPSASPARARQEEKPDPCSNLVASIVIPSFGGQLGTEHWRGREALVVHFPGKQFQSTTSTKTLLNSKASNEKSGAAMTSGKSHKPTLWDLVSNPEAFTGSDTTIIGMVYKGKRLSSDSFYCYRLLMVCCAADASPEGVIVKWPGTAKLKKGAWVKVQGKVGLTIFEGEDYPTILATMVEKTRPPKNKFIVPR